MRSCLYCKHFLREQHRDETGKQHELYGCALLHYSPVDAKSLWDIRIAVEHAQACDDFNTDIGERPALHIVIEPKLVAWGSGAIIDATTGEEVGKVRIGPSEAELTPDQWQEFLRLRDG
jgi:hypothetical protein